ncbi:MAG: recombination and strand exchange inhibitor protein [Haloplasmataceae bacterium]|nr:recombination and strand exchange inhibitor protein [Haloplasmataceae bacterium]
MFTSYKTLEFDKIIDKLHQYASCSLGNEAINDIEIIKDLDTLQALLNETDEALKLIYRMGELPLGGITDIRPYIKRATIGGILNVTELVAIVDFIYGVNQIKIYMDKVINERIEVKYINEYINNLIYLSSLRKDINLCIDDFGKIADDATPKLKEIRSTIKVYESRIKEKLNNILNTKREYLTESLVTIRNDRYVVPVRVEYKNTFEGIIHDQSQSGSTIYIEPKAVVDMNNKIHTLILDEKAEIEKILRKLTEKVAENANELSEDCENVKCLDFIYAKAKYAREISAVKPIINDSGIIKIYKARHPLISKDEVVPNDIFLGEEFNTIVITGPNTGGKTVTLKTVGLFTLMMQAGLLVPANDESHLAVFDNIFADIGDEQSIEQSLSTFSSHMKNIINIVNNITINSLILFDELGAGTDPKEGAALAMSILDYFHERGSRVIATTHYPELKTYAYNNKKVINASVEFNVETLKPTYRLMIGIPGRSNALEISRRLGLIEKIIDKAKDKVETEKTDVANLIIQLENQGLYLQNLVSENEIIKNNLNREKNQFESKINELESQKESIINKARLEAVSIIKKAQKEANEVVEELKELKRNKEANYKEHEVIDIKSKLNTKNYYEENIQESKTYRELKVGDTVRVLTLNRTGQILEKVNESEWLVQIGILTSRVNAKSLELIEEKKQEEEYRTNKVTIVKASSQKTELDLRGERFEEALIKLDKFIDSALLNNLHQVYVIHGHGTGALRKGVQNYLKKCPSVKEYRYGGQGEGGVGVTVVNFK